MTGTFPNEPQKPVGYNGHWLQIGFDATSQAAQLRMQGELTDEQLLQYAANLQASMGGSNVKFHVSTSVNGHTAGSYTLAQINAWVVSAANAGGSAAQYKTQAAQSVFGRAQTMLNQWVTDAQGFVSSENNVATSADPQNVQQMLQVLSSFNQLLSQLASLHVQ